MFVKMCGMMRREDLAMCGELGIDAAGIVVEYPSPVPWNVDRVAGRRLVAEAPQGLQVVMVTSGTPRDIAELASYVQPHMVQVHGEESLKDVAEIVERLRPLGIGVFRALRIVPKTKQAAGEITDPRDAQALAASGVKGIVVDSKVPRRPGGTGSRRRRNHRRHRAGRRRAHRGRGRPERGKRRRGDQARTAVGRGRPYGRRSCAGRERRASHAGVRRRRACGGG